MPTQPTDTNKLHSAIRKMSNDQVFYRLEEAIELLPQAKLTKLVKQYLDPEQLRPDTKAKGSLLKEIKAFEKSSRKGEYYEDFMVNSGI